MIISASRRTDIPAFYSEWLLNRLEAGYTIVPNPRNACLLERVTLSPFLVDCIVFWSKNPRPMINKLKKIEDMGYFFYFLFSLLPYDRTIETNLPPKSDLLNTFADLSRLIGADRVIWRYDPIIVDEVHTADWHLKQFRLLCESLSQFTRQCIISFVDPYKRISTDFRAINREEVFSIASRFSKIAEYYNLSLFTCAEEIDLSIYNIEHSSCIDKKLIEKIIGCTIVVNQDTRQRPACRCIKSVEIGVYDTCINGCRYCYATSNTDLASNRIQKHDPKAPMLTGYPSGCEIISDVTVPSQKDRQLNLFLS